MTELEAAVNAFSRRGLSIIRCGPDKRPLGPWAEFQRRRPTKRELREWFGGGASASIGVVCGPVSGGLVVLDLDDLDVAQAVGCDLELQRSTSLVESPSGGLHLWLRQTEGAARCQPLRDQSGRAIGDLKGLGGYVLAPPSPGYRFISEAEPLAVSDAYAWAAELLRGVGVELADRHNGDGPAEPIGESIPQGQRNAALTSLAGSMRRRGASEASIRAALEAENAARCQPPLEASEVAGIAASVGRYPPATFVSFAPVPLGSRMQTNPCALPWKTARQVAEATPEAVDFIAPPYVARGEITGLAGKLKVGKSTLTAHLIRGVTTGGLFLGEPCQQGAVLLLTEQRVGTLRELLERAGLLDSEDLHVLHLHDTAGVPWPDVAASAIEKAREAGAILLVVDTISRFARIADENDAGSMNAAMTPLEDAAAAGLAVWAPHHERKSGGTVEDAGRGSSAFGGAVDILLRLRRGEGNTPRTVRVLEALSRFDATPEQAAIELVDGQYLPRGTEDAVILHQARAALDDVLTAEPAGIEELRGRLDGIKDTTLRAALAEAVRDGRAERTGEGKRGSPYQWRGLSFATSI